jgi:effector-binding domain-containing protein
MKGSLSLTNSAFGTLYTFVAESGFIPAVPPSRVYFNVPGQVPEQELKWELRVPIAGICGASGPDGKGLGFRCLEETTIACTIHIGPFSTIGDTYNKLKSWIADNGYKISGPCEEVYLTEPGNTPPAEILTEVRFMVSKK